MNRFASLVTAATLGVLVTTAPAMAGALCYPIQSLPQVHANSKAAGMVPLLHYKSTVAPVPTTVMFVINPETGDVAVIAIAKDRFCIVDNGTGFAPKGPEILEVPPLSPAEELGA